MSHYSPPAPNEWAGDPKQVFPLELCRHVVPLEVNGTGVMWIAYDQKFKSSRWRYATQEDVDNKMPCCDPQKFSDRQPGDIVEVGDVIPSRFQLCQVWCTAEYTNLIQQDEKTVEILKALRDSNWEDRTLFSKLKGRLKLVFDMQYFAAFQEAESAWLTEMKAADPERYHFIKEEGLATESEPNPQQKMVIRRVFSNDLELIAHWCMANFSCHPLEWRGAVEIKPFDLAKFQPVDPIPRASKKPAAPKKLTLKERLARMSPAERAAHEISVRNQKLLARLQRRNGVDTSVLDILGIDTTQ